MNHGPWTKVDEQLPPLNTYVLIYYSKEYVEADKNWHWDKKNSRYFVGMLKKEYEGGYEWWDDECIDIVIAPSHWTYLPEAPK